MLKMKRGPAKAIDIQTNKLHPYIVKLSLPSKFVDLIFCFVCIFAYIHVPCMIHCALLHLYRALRL